MCTVAIFGSSNETSIKKYAKKQGISILFDDGKRNQRSAKYRSMINKADVVTIMVDAVKHHSAEKAKELAKELNKPMVFPKGRGISVAINQSLDVYKKSKK